MKLAKNLQYAVEFAKFSTQFAISPDVLAKLIALNRKKVHLPIKKEVRRKELIVLINDLVNQCGCSVDWGGEEEGGEMYGWPMIKKNGMFKDLPVYRP